MIVRTLLLPTFWALLMVAAPAGAAAQSAALKLPTTVATTAAAADWASTYYGLKFHGLREANPVLSRWSSAPGKLVTIGGLIDAGGMTAWNLTVGRKHPRVAAAGLWGMAAFRTVLAIHNLRNARKAARRHDAPASRR